MALEDALARELLEAHPDDAAAVLERLPAGEVAALLDAAPAEVVAAVLRHMATPSAVACLGRLAPERGAAALAALPLDTAAVLVRRLEREAQEPLLAALPPAAAAPLAALLRYPERTAGAVMDPRVLALPEDLSVEEALAHVQRTPQHVLYYLYVVGRARGLVGVLNLRELMLAHAAAPLGAVMRSATARLGVRDGLQAVVAHPGWRGLHALPVVDEAGVFVGAVRYETMRRLAADADRPPRIEGPLGTLLGLGELCWIGLAGVVEQLASARARPAPGGSAEERRDR
ncbi:MAG: CBS domain-containing protein [Candidatus Rokubacteria bacterium]|nr:CBS domain-containing protein [Candidatus Rokubacteria bacterium]